MSVSAEVQQRIAGYVPARREVREGLGDQGLRVVRGAVEAVGPDDVGLAARLLTHAATHVVWALASGAAPQRRKVFDVGLVEQSITEARRQGRPGVAPYAAHLRRLAVGGQAPRPVCRTERAEPYTVAEQEALLAAAVGMPALVRRWFEAQLALGLGAGLTGTAAASVTAADLTLAADEVVVRPAGGHPVVVGRRWAPLVLAAAGETAAGEALTEAYGNAGRQRLDTASARASDCPVLSAARLRATWIVGQLQAGVPLDVVATVTGVRWGTAAGYLTVVAAPSLEEMRGWLAGDGQAAPTAPATSFAGIDARPAGPQQRDGGDLAGLLAAFTPRHAGAAALWQGPLGAELSERIAAAAGGSAERGRHLLTAVAQLLAWVSAQPEIPHRADALLKDSTLARWAAVRRREGQTEGSVASYLARLRMLAGHAGGAAPPLAALRPRGRRTADPDLDGLERLAGCAHTAARLGSAVERRVLAAHVHLAAGAGASYSEIGAVRGEDIDEADGVVTVRLGASNRRVAVAAAHASGVAALRRQTPAGQRVTGLGSDRTLRQRDRIAKRIGVAVDVPGLRQRWLAGLLGRGVPADVISAAAGVQLTDVAAEEHGPVERSLAERVAWTAQPDHGRSRPPAAGVCAQA